MLERYRFIADILDLALQHLTVLADEGDLEEEEEELVELLKELYAALRTKGT